MCLLLTQLLPKRKNMLFFSSCSWSYQGLQQCFFKEMYSSLISTVCCLSSSVLTSVAALCGVMAALFPRTRAQSWTIFSHLAGGERTCTPLHQTHTRKFRDDDKAAFFGGIKVSRFCLVRVTYPMLVDAHSEATVYSDPVFGNNKNITHI